MRAGKYGRAMNENPNELVAYLLIGAVVLFLLGLTGSDILRQLQIMRTSRRRKRRQNQHYAARTDQAVAPPVTTDEPDADESSADAVVELFDRIDHRLTKLRSDIDAIDTAESDRVPAPPIP